MCIYMHIWPLLSHEASLGLLKNNSNELEKILNMYVELIGSNYKTSTEISNDS